MTRVMAALDDSATGEPILATALALTRTFGGHVQAIHVVVDGRTLVKELAEAAGIPLVELEGEVAPELIKAASRHDVRALVIGARGTAAGARPAGRTALAVAERLRKPIVVVPPDSRHPGRLDRILVPLEGTVPSALALRRVMELATRASLEIVVLHVYDSASLPSFTDQPHHELETWGHEFVSRYCPPGIEELRLEVRVGRADELVPRVAEETDADLIALSWAQGLAADRAPVIRAVLTQAHVPVMLIPVTMPSGVGADLLRGEGRQGARA